MKAQQKINPSLYPKNQFHVHDQIRQIIRRFADQSSSLTSFALKRTIPSQRDVIEKLLLQIFNKFENIYLQAFLSIKEELTQNKLAFNLTLLIQNLSKFQNPFNNPQNYSKKQAFILGQNIEQNMLNFSVDRLQTNQQYKSLQQNTDQHLSRKSQQLGVNNNSQQRVSQSNSIQHSSFSSSGRQLEIQMSYISQDKKQNFKLKNFQQEFDEDFFGFLTEESKQFFRLFLIEKSSILSKIEKKIRMPQQKKEDCLQMSNSSVDSSLVDSSQESSSSQEENQHP